MQITVKAAESEIRARRSFTAGNLVGQALFVLTPASTVPAALREGQEARSAAYMAGEGREMPLAAPGYVVTSYGVVVAWVDLAGNVIETNLSADQATTTTRRHQALALRALRG